MRIFLLIYTRSVQNVCVGGDEYYWRSVFGKVSSKFFIFLSLANLLYLVSLRMRKPTVST